MPLLWYINARNSKVGSVTSTPRHLTGVYVDGVPYGPNRDEIRPMIKRQWRKAFDAAQEWHDKASGVVKYSLYAKRGKFLADVYATPKHFEAGVPTDG